MVSTTPRRRWFRFSLRTLFVVVTVTSLLIVSLIALDWYLEAKSTREKNEHTAPLDHVPLPDTD
jgi:hypothetical protein